jgi:HPt (histidine-containing phosphotransfer) domain-containing protein
MLVVRKKTFRPAVVRCGELLQKDCGMNTTPSQTTWLQSTLRGDPDLEALVEMFVDEMPERIAAIQRCSETDDIEGVRRLVHQIKGSAGSHGFQPISECAARLEDSIRDRHPEQEIHQEVQDLIAMCARARL